MDIREPEITREQILALKDDNFTVGNVCIVTGAGTGIGRATALAAAVNNLMTVGLDINEKEGKKTEHPHATHRRRLQHHVATIGCQRLQGTTGV